MFVGLLSRGLRVLCLPFGFSILVFRVQGEGFKLLRPVCIASERIPSPGSCAKSLDL